MLDGPGKDAHPFCRAGDQPHQENSVKEVGTANIARQLAATLRQSNSETGLDKAYSMDHSTPNIAAMKSDCCGSNNYQNKRLAHE